MATNHGHVTLKVTDVPVMMEIIEAAFDVLITAQERGQIKSYDIELARLHRALERVASRPDEEAS